MSVIEKKVLYGTRQEIVLSPKEGYEVTSVEVINKSTGEIVPSQLTKTSENPLQCICSFIQPAGVVAIRPKMNPILYSVIIEECEACDIVLLESSDLVDIRLADGNNVSTSGEVSEAVGGEERASHQKEDADEGPIHNRVLEPGEGPTQMTEAHGATYDGAGDTQGDAGNFNVPQHSGDNIESAEKATGVEESADAAGMADVDENENGVAFAEDVDEELSDNGVSEDDDTVSQDSVYDPGEFAAELEEVEPVRITKKEYDEKCKLFWQYRDKWISGEITQAKFEEVKKKHTQFMNDVSSGKIVVE